MKDLKVAIIKRETINGVETETMIAKPTSEGYFKNLKKMHDEMSNDHAYTIKDLCKGLCGFAYEADGVSGEIFLREIEEVDAD